MRNGHNVVFVSSMFIIFGWFWLSMYGIVPDPITPFVKFAQGDIPLLNRMKDMDCVTLESWIVNNTGSLMPYQTEAKEIHNLKCIEQKQNNMSEEKQ